MWQNIVFAASLLTGLDFATSPPVVSLEKTEMMLPVLEFVSLTPQGVARFEATETGSLPRNCYLTLLRVSHDVSLREGIGLQASDVALFTKRSGSPMTRFSPPRGIHTTGTRSIVLRQRDLRELESGTEILLFVPDETEYRLTKIFRDVKLSPLKRRSVDDLLRNNETPTIRLSSIDFKHTMPIVLDGINAKYDVYLSSSFAQGIHEVGIQLMIQNYFKDFVFAPSVPVARILPREIETTNTALPQDVYLTLYTVPEKPKAPEWITMYFDKAGNCDALAGYVEQDGQVQDPVVLSIWLNHNGELSYRTAKFHQDYPPGTRILLYFPLHCQLKLNRIRAGKATTSSLSFNR